jgi:hypothetical protein
MMRLVYVPTVEERDREDADAAHAGEDVAG